MELPLWLYCQKRVKVVPCWSAEYAVSFVVVEVGGMSWKILSLWSEKTEIERTWKSYEVLGWMFEWLPPQLGTYPPYHLYP